MSSYMRKYPWVPEAREALCASKPPHSVEDERDRLIIDGNVISVTRWNLRVSFISNLFQPENVTIFVKVAYGRRAATGSPHHLLVKVFAKPLVGAGGPPGQ